MAGRSPASSPRLPSPPPIAEDQIGPQSPGISLYEEDGKVLGSSTLDTGASRRIHRGTTADEMAEGPPLIELQDIDSAFQLTEHLKALHYSQTHPPDSTTTRPITAEIASQLARPPPNTSMEIWLYELGRFLIQKTNAIIVALFADMPPCSSQTCPEMRASEWQYLCAVHDPPKSCSAIDYCCHTLDWAATTLTSSKMFPSRLGLGSGNAVTGSDKVLQQQMKEITNIFRRVYRIYAHAWFQHREMFWRVESKTGLYIFFKTVCDEYGLIQPENYTIPPEAEGLEPVEPTRQAQPEALQGLSVMKREIGSDHDMTEPVLLPQEPAASSVVPSGDTSKRNRHTTNDRSSSISTVIHEEAEDDEDSSRRHAIDAVPDAPLLKKQVTALKGEPGLSLPSEVMKQENAEPANSNAVEIVEEPSTSVKRSDMLKPAKDEAPVAAEPEADVTEFKIEVAEVEPLAEIVAAQKQVTPAQTETIAADHAAVAETQVAATTNME
ncbi:Hypothetical protein R9X50_00220500 [Acrodontium crateriforme]|uniref:Mob1/phocein n=1 Tax=Acrodontium crateriforme TaxID=150365 RepID=A0AAQ3M1U2_9PEZI|nr:Hypothetical protein R9X50_00220500 [Acrodontium crateriforme]